VTAPVPSTGSPLMPALLIGAALAAAGLTMFSLARRLPH
jgi:hypothetical protein